MTGLKKLAIFWLAAMLLLGVSLLTIPTTAKAQNIGTYTEQSTGNTKQALGVVVIPGTTERWLRYSPPTGGITNSTTGVTVFPAVSNRVIHVMGGQCYSDGLFATIANPCYRWIFPRFILGTIYSPDKHPHSAAGFS
jgi:hypothetical protein